MYEVGGKGTSLPSESSLFCFAALACGWIMCFGLFLGICFRRMGRVARLTGLNARAEGEVRGEWELAEEFLA